MQKLEADKKEAEKIKKREEAERKKELPMSKAQVYLKGLANDITECARCEIAATSSKTLRPVLKAEYEKMFKSHTDELKRQRAAIEQALAAEKVPVPLLTAAHDKIAAFHLDKDAFKKSADVYAKEDKPADAKPPAKGAGRAGKNAGGAGQAAGNTAGGASNEAGNTGGHGAAKAKAKQ